MDPCIILPCLLVWGYSPFLFLSWLLLSIRFPVFIHYLTVVFYFYYINSSQYSIVTYGLGSEVPSHLWRCWFPTHTPHLCLVYLTGVSDHPRPRTGIPVTLFPPGVVHSVQLLRLWDSGPRNNSLSLWDSDPRGMSPLIWDSDPSTIPGFWAQVHALYHHCQLIGDSELTSHFYQFYEYAWSNWAFALPACALIADSCLWLWSLTWLLLGSAPCDNSKTPLSSPEVPRGIIDH